MRRVVRWLVPGLGVKRWLALFALGLFLMGLGLSLFFGGTVYAQVEQFFRAVFEGSSWVQPVRGLVALGVALLGGCLAVFAVLRLIKSMLEALLPPVPHSTPAEAFYRQRSLVQGPKVVAIGGGTGLPVTLRGLKGYTANITAVVTVADDGGSSGRLRNEFNVLPPGDIRNCLVALADTETLMEELFQHRFTNGGGLEGHSFGNLFLVAMAEITGDFDAAIRKSSEVLAVRGRVLPATLENVVLGAELNNGGVVTGESLIGRTRGIRRVYLDPPDAQPLPQTLAAIAEAETIVLGPGSLYTSILPNLLVPGVAEAIRASKALKIYVCNVMTQPGETDGYTAAQHVQAILDHAGPGVIDVCLVNDRPIPPEQQARYRQMGAQPVEIDAPALARLGVQIRRADLLGAGDLLRHDAAKLGIAIGRIILENLGRSGRSPWEFQLLRRQLLDATKGG